MLPKQKRLPRFQRQPEAARGRQITRTSLAILDTLKRYRIITTSLIKPLVEANPCVTLRHLRRLFDRALINRFPLPNQWGLPGEFAYYLDSSQALDVLTTFLGVQHQETDYKKLQRNRERWHDNRHLFADHELMISRMQAMLELACKQSRGSIELVSFQQGSALYHWVEAGEERLPLRPDALFTLKLTASGEQFHYFYEADRQTEDTGRLANKMRAYFQLIVKQKGIAAVYGINRIRAVLFETLSTHHADQIRAAASRKEISNNPSPLFWFTASEFYTHQVETPTGLLPAFQQRPEMIFDPRWLSPADDTLHSILDS